MVEMDQNLEQIYSRKSNNIKVKAATRATNGAEKSKKCNQCEYASSKSSHFRTHLRTHSGEKPNKCNWCDYASLGTFELRRHSKTHSGEKPNKCNQCDYASSHAGNLRTHLKVHSGEKKYKEVNATKAIITLAYYKIFSALRKKKMANF